MRYDQQARQFDDRAAVPGEAGAAIAGELAEMLGLAPGRRWLEIGPGTGSLSIHLVRQPIRYAGLDGSREMLSVFRERLEREGLTGELRVGDANDPWPFDDESVAVVFSARAVHHLDPRHVVAEALRVARPDGAWLVLGHVCRPSDSVSSVMRREMRRLLRERGYAGRDHGQAAEAILRGLEEAGGRRVGPRTAARWTRERSPAEALAGWEGKPGLAGLEVPPDVKAAVLAELREWAAGRYGDLEKPLSQDERFELAGVSLDSRA